MKLFTKEVENAEHRLNAAIKAAKDTYKREIEEINRRFIETLPIKIGDIVTVHQFNRDNVKTNEEKVRIARITMVDDGDSAIITINHYSDKKRKWLNKEERLYDIFEKDGVYYIEGYTPFTGGLPLHYLTPYTEDLYTD